MGVGRTIAAVAVATSVAVTVEAGAATVVAVDTDTVSVREGVAVAACCKMAGWDEGAVCGEQAARANINRNAHMTHVRERNAKALRVPPALSVDGILELFCSSTVEFCISDIGIASTIGVLYHA